MTVAVLRQDLGVPCLTDPKEIAAWLKRKHHGLTVVFTTYQSGEALAKAARSAKFTLRPRHHGRGAQDRRRWRTNCSPTCCTTRICPSAAACS